MTATHDDWRLMPPELERAPELAVLAVLDRTLEIATYAVLTAHLELTSEPPPHWRPHAPDTRCAEKLIRQADRLQRSLRRYRDETVGIHATETPSEPSAGGDDIPF